MPILWADVDQETYTQLSYLATLRQIPIQALAAILLRAAAARVHAQVRASNEPRTTIRRLLRELDEEAERLRAGTGT
jgi:hypothetical protein